MTTLIIIAKETIAGRVKTRLHPPLSLEQAAIVAAAALADTLAAMEAVQATRRILFFDGNRLPPGSERYEMTPQPAGTLDERLAAIFDASSGPTLLIGMDTPQVQASDLADAFDAWPSDIDAFYGPANDGGFWALGMAEPRGDLILGVPMSRDDTGEIQLQRLVDAGLTVSMLPTLTDVDTIDSARAVAELAPQGTFASALAGFGDLS